jgi:hypothetical protein
MPDVLIGYVFDDISHRYRSSATGRYVARGRIVELLDAQIQQRADRLARLTFEYASNRLAPGQWLAAMRDELRRAHLQNRALGVGGWDRLTQRDYGIIGRRLQDDYRRLVGFAEQIRLGEVSEAEAINRLNMYLGQARWQYWNAVKEHQQPSQPGFAIIERRVLGASEHCDDCIIYARVGWRPQGVLPRPSEQSRCDGNCACTIETREVPVAEAVAMAGSTD